MQSHCGAAADQSPKPGKKPKSREVSSRFLSPTSNNNSSSSPNSVSPLKPTNFKPARSSTDSRKHKSFDHSSGFLRGLWPSSKPADTSSNTLADRLTDNLVQQQRKAKQKPNPVALSSLGRQRSCTEFSRFEEEDDDKKIQKENHKPAIFGGGSMRYTATSSGKFKFPAKSSTKSSIHDQNDITDHVVPGRFSVDETAIRKKSSARGFLSDSESEYSDAFSAGGTGTSFDTPAASYMAPTVSSRKHGIEVPSKFMHDLSLSRSRRWSADNSNSNSDNNNNNNSPKNNNNNSPKIFSLKSAMKGTTNNIGSLDFSPTNTKPPTSPSKGRKGVGNILSMGIFELLKGKKSSSNNNNNAVATSPLGPGSVEKVHELRLLHNSLMQWRYANARAQLVNGNVIKQAERKLVYVWNGLIKLRQSVLQKKLQLQKEKLKMKLNYMLHSQMKALEMWGNMEKRHLSAVSTTKDHLHSVVCRIPLVDGAKVEQESTSNALRHASHLAASIGMTITTFSPAIEKAVVVVAELATVVTLEKLLLQECFDLFSCISALEIQERSLKGSIMQLRILQQQQQYT
ncbi:hypothetical protein ABFS83_08G109300 [Erythranthe nasuta]